MKDGYAQSTQYENQNEIYKACKQLDHQYRLLSDFRPLLEHFNKSLEILANVLKSIGVCPAIDSQSNKINDFDL